VGWGQMRILQPQTFNNPFTTTQINVTTTQLYTAWIINWMSCRVITSLIVERQFDSNKSTHQILLLQRTDSCRENDVTTHRLLGTVKAENQTRMKFATAVTTVVSGAYLFNSVTASSREFFFTNNCNKDLWLYFTSGSAPYANGQTFCHSNTDCITGSECDLNNGLCFWNVPVPSTGVYRLPKDGGNSTIEFPIFVNDIVWSGNIRACIDGTCDSTPAECDKSGCRVKGPSPVTLVPHPPPSS
jgi:hypothetical protein